MPAIFSISQGAFTPATNQDNYTVDATGATGNFGKIRYVGWGGRLGSAASYRTRWARPSTSGASTFTSLNPVPNGVLSSSNAPACRAGTFATAPVLPADPQNLHGQDWNAFGGVGVLVLPLGAEWFFANTADPYREISCRNVAGTDASGSSYDACWEE